MILYCDMLSFSPAGHADKYPVTTPPLSQFFTSHFEKMIDGSKWRHVLSPLSPAHLKMQNAFSRTFLFLSSGE